MLDDQLLISELAKRAGVSVRTIRFYISEGLLPPPQARGRYSLYDEEYLTRIELIKLLKNAYLPLKEIKRIVESLSRQEIESMLEQLNEPSFLSPSPGAQTFYQSAEDDPTRSDASSSSSGVRESGLPDALDYISKVLHSQTGSGALKGMLAPPASPAPQVPPPMPQPLNQSVQPPARARASQREADADAGASQPDESESSWRRYTIQPGVELLVSEDVYSLSAQSIHRIIAQIKQLFSTFPSGGKNV